MTEEEFWDTDMRSLFNRLYGYREAELTRQKQAWERARYVARAAVSVHVPKKDKSKIEKAFRLPWDDEDDTRRAPRIKKLTPEELARQEAETVRIEKKLQKILG